MTFAWSRGERPATKVCACIAADSYGVNGQLLLVYNGEGRVGRTRGVNQASDSVVCWL